MTLVKKIYIYIFYHYYYFFPPFSVPPADDGTPSIHLCCLRPGPALLPLHMTLTCLAKPSRDS